MLPTLLQSSIDPTKLSSTIRGIIISLSSIVILFASTHLHINVTTNQIAAFADQTAATVSAVGLAIGMIHTLYGLVVKIVNKLANK